MSDEHVCFNVAEMLVLTSVRWSVHYHAWRLRGPGGSVQWGAVVRDLLQSARGARGSGCGEQHGVQRLLSASGTCRTAGQWTVKRDRYQFFYCQMGTHGGFRDLHSQFRYKQIAKSFKQYIFFFQFRNHCPCPLLRESECKIPFFIIIVIINLFLFSFWCREPPEETKRSVQRCDLQGHVAFIVPSKERMLG